MAQKVEIPMVEDQAPAEGRLRFVGTVELGGTVTGQMLGILFGPESNVDGSLQFDGPVTIDGTYRGSIRTSDSLVVGEHAKIEANVTCRSAEVSGEVTGNITATESVTLKAYAHVRGDITAQSLGIEKGVVFDGTSKMGTVTPRSRRNRT